MRRKLHGSNKKRKPKTLLIDGEVLLKSGFSATKQIQDEFGSIGTIYHFLNTIKRFYIQYRISKVVVFWEGVGSRDIRRVYYPRYKMNREEFPQYTPEQQEDLGRQRMRIKQYLEELYIRQIEVDYSEADDCIAQYCHISENERKLIYTVDRDLLQLLSEDTHIYLSDKKVVINLNNYHKYFRFHHENISIIKSISGDPADNISGIKNVGDETAVKLYPEIKERKLTISEIKDISEKLLLDENVTNSKKNAVRRILNGETKWGNHGDDYFEVMDKVINLTTPIISEEGKELIEIMYDGVLEPEGRGGMNEVNKMLKEDGVYKLLPKTSENYYNFWASFISIIRKEQLNYNKYGKEESE